MARALLCMKSWIEQKIGENENNEDNIDFESANEEDIDMEESSDDE